jgi:hypothetical protein
MLLDMAIGRLAGLSSRSDAGCLIQYGSRCLHCMSHTAAIHRSSALPLAHRIRQARSILRLVQPFARPALAGRRRVRGVTPTRLPDFGRSRPSIRCDIPVAIATLFQLHERPSLEKLRQHLGDSFPLVKLMDRLRCERCSSQQIVITFLAPDQRTGNLAHLFREAPWR